MGGEGQLGTTATATGALEDAGAAGGPGKSTLPSGLHSLAHREVWEDSGDGTDEVGDSQEGTLGTRALMTVQVNVLRRHKRQGRNQRLLRIQTVPAGSDPSNSALPIPRRGYFRRSHRGGN